MSLRSVSPAFIWPVAWLFHVMLSAAWVFDKHMHGAWCMVHGAWCMVHGAWCMDGGGCAGWNLRAFGGRRPTARRDAICRPRRSFGNLDFVVSGWRYSTAGTLNLADSKPLPLKRAASSRQN